jgi:glycosyltransferase involved in cell wall biosynthesis
VDLDLVILDNASTDDTPEVVRSIGDPRIEYIRHPTDIGILRNWNRSIQMAARRSPVTCIFHDDDLMLPG